jgi:hypothetical protein
MNYQEFAELIFKSDIEKMNSKEDLEKFAKENNLQVRPYNDYDWGFVCSLTYEDEKYLSGFGGFALTKVKWN